MRHARSSRPGSSRWGRALGSAALVGTLVGGVAGIAAQARLAVAEPAVGTEESELAKKAEWQGRYRALRNNVARMQENAKKLHRSYGLAQHANYPRGGARENLRIRAEKAERAAARYAEEIEALHDEARRNGIPPGWLLEVEDEPIDYGLPADRDESDEMEDSDREGRNPLYLEDDDEDDESDEDEDDESDDDF